MSIQFKRGIQGNVDYTSLKAGQPAISTNTGELVIGLKNNDSPFNGGSHFISSNIFQGEDYDIYLTSREGMKTSRNNISGIYISPSYDYVYVWTAYLGPKADRINFTHTPPSWSGITSSDKQYFVAKVPAGDSTTPFANDFNLIKLYLTYGEGDDIKVYTTWFNFTKETSNIPSSEALLCFFINQPPTINISNNKYTVNMEAIFKSSTGYSSLINRKSGYFKYDGEKLQPVGNMLPLEKTEIPITFPFSFDVKLNSFTKKYMMAGDTSSPYTYILNLYITCNGVTKSITTIVDSWCFGAKNINSDDDYCSYGLINFSQETDDYIINWQGQLLFYAEELSEGSLGDIYYLDSYEGATLMPSLEAYITLKNTPKILLWTKLYCVKGTSSGGSYTTVILEENTTLFRELKPQLGTTWTLPSITLGAPDEYGGRILLIGYEYVPIQGSTLK